MMKLALFEIQFILLSKLSDSSMLKMCRRSPYGEEIRSKTIMLWKQRMPPCKIARDVNVSLTTVYRWIRRWKQDGSMRLRPRNGRPKKFMIKHDTKNKIILDKLMLNLAIAWLPVCYHQQLRCATYLLEPFLKWYFYPSLSY